MRLIRTRRYRELHDCAKSERRRADTAEDCVEQLMEALDSLEELAGQDTDLIRRLRAVLTGGQDPASPPADESCPSAHGGRYTPAAPAF
ncbi:MULTISPECIES: hypothetical protein [Streptomyces]|uniref:hypothetical protein n=1 Tax=Streptomyces TaxID=1883 RepID=UPI0004CD2871|nr:MULTISPECIES: hypothetical protein [Streptomyces]KOT47135.1 hypothetical protein ADK43_40380 [Streptomyces rimosus subsp. rimosus]